MLASVSVRATSKLRSPPILLARRHDSGSTEQQDLMKFGLRGFGRPGHRVFGVRCTGFWSLDLGWRALGFGSLDAP